jgi:hypothetical protein
LPGTPLCPEPEVQSSSLGCTVNVQGQDDISLVTGLGTFRGDFATVVAGDNPFDGPELVVLRGEFRGDMDFEPAIVRQIPYGTVVGWVRARGGRRTDFTGVFRLPFDGNATTEVEVAPGTTVTLTLRQLFCPATPDPNRNFEDIDKFNGIDLAYLDNVDAAATPAGRCVNIKLDELSLGVPLVRFNIDF